MESGNMRLNQLSIATPWHPLHATTVTFLKWAVQMFNLFVDLEVFCSVRVAEKTFCNPIVAK